jgi:hypothetical protein
LSLIKMGSFHEWFLSLFLSTIFINAVLFAFGVFVLLKVCKTEKIIFPMSIILCMLIYSVSCVLDFTEIRWLISYY